MTMDNEKIKADQLSSLIDALNNKEQPESNDPELQELADLALLVKQAAGQTKPTPETVNCIAKQLKDESKVKSKRRFSWLYSGAAGMAAAVLLVAVTNFMPGAPGQTEQQLNPQVQISEVLPQTDAKSGGFDAQQKISDKADILNIAAQVQPIVSNPTAEVHPKVQPKPQAPKQTSAPTAQADVMAARATDGQTKQAGVLAIPGKNVKTRSVDSGTGAIKQIYAFDNNKEVTITQKAKDSGAAKPDSQARIAVMKEAAEDKDTKTAQDSSNRITTDKDKYEVTVEGELPKEELQEIADSLVETDGSAESGKE